jgi:hypothetical protein
VTELTEPLAAASAETITVVAQPSDDAHAVSFSELVYAHFDWWRARQAGGADQTVSRAHDAARAAFEQRHGQIVNAYWCSQVESAVALTEKKRFRGLLAPAWGFHRESDWATQDSPDVAAELHRCDELAVRANTVLTGVRQRICMQLIVASAAHLLSLVDARASNADEATTSAALTRERAAIRKAEAYYSEASNGQAQMVYFAGMAAVTFVLSLVAAIWLTISWATPVAALIAGAIGAVVSVIQRITSGHFTLETDVGGYPFFLGGLRPLIGGAFAMAISFAFTGGLLHLPVAANESTDNRRLALLVLGFIAGFSERWAQDTLTSVLPASHQTVVATLATTATAENDGAETLMTPVRPHGS